MDIVIIILFGLIFGSFANVCIYRIPKELSVFKPARSFCPSCRQTIKWYDNIPIFSYLLLKGKCRHCGAVISLKYPVVEFLTAVLFYVVYISVGFNSLVHIVPLLFWWLFMWTLIVGSAIDIKLRIIPDVFTIGLCIAGVFFSTFNNLLGFSGFFILKRIVVSIVGAIAGLFLGLVVAWLGERIFKKESFGGADIKLLAAFGAWLGASGAFWSLFAASFVGSVVSIVLILLKRITAKDYVPFGPYLSVGAILVFLLAFS